MKYKLQELEATPFNKLETFLSDKSICPDYIEIDLSMGQPYHMIPQLVFDTLNAKKEQWTKYPPVNATMEYRNTVARWLERRYNLPQGFIESGNILPVSGTREGLFTIVQAIDAYKDGQKPLKVAIPNPCFQTYQAAIVMCGGETIILDAHRDNNFFPELQVFTSALCQQLTALYICTPSNPQGMFASYEYIESMIKLAQQYDFTIIFDHCYSEIYTDSPPVGAIEVVHQRGLTFDNLIIMHSLSKRSNIAGMRSGFVMGDPKIMSLYSKIRSFSCAGMPLPIVEATIALLKDENHVEHNRMLYRKKFYAARDIFYDYNKFIMPQGGIFLWLEVNDAERICEALWRHEAIKVLPGNFMTLSSIGHVNHGKKYIRIAMVQDHNIMIDALKRIRTRILIEESN